MEVESRRRASGCLRDFEEYLGLEFFRGFRSAHSDKPGERFFGFFGELEFRSLEVFVVLVRVW